jgi:hypothetical protein
MSTANSRKVSRTTKRFFQHIANRQWSNARELIRQLHKGTATKDQEWKIGYITALQGMLAARRYNHTAHPPFIAQMEVSSDIDALETYFYEQTQHQLNTEFDKGFFQTWYEYTYFLKNQ